MALSAPLLSRKRVIKVKLEATKGTKVAGDQAILVDDLEIYQTAPFIERRGTGLYRGNSFTGVIGEYSGKCSFKTELRGDGAHAMDAAVAILLQACGFTKTVEVYNIHSTHTNDKTISIDVWEDGVKKSLRGCSGNVTFEGEYGKPMYLTFEFDGIWQTVADDALPAWAPATRNPLRMGSSTFTIATNAIKVGKLSLNMGCKVTPRADITAVGGITYFMITDYEGPILSIDPEADLVAGYDFNGLWLAGTEAAVSLALTDGTDIVTFTIPKVQIKELKGGDRDGIAIYDYTGQCNHSAGNDAVAIAVT